MKRLKVKDFGPIGDGLQSGDGSFDFGRLTIFCGPQASGKSSIVKLYSTFSWIEKALVRGDFSIKYLTQYNRFRKVFCAYQNVHHYFHQSTELHYEGEAYEMVYRDEHLMVQPMRTIDAYERPQIIYMPAERNLISVLEDADNVKRLPPSLATVVEEYGKACRSMQGRMKLPVSGAEFDYDRLNRQAKIVIGGQSVKVQEASSGLQSVAPLFVVTDYLAKKVDHQIEGGQNHDRSAKEQERLKTRLEELLRDDAVLGVLDRTLLLKTLMADENKYLLNVVEEPEQNLFPDSQCAVLNALVAISKHTPKNQLVITTHSPYLIDQIALLIKAQHVVARGTEWAALPTEVKAALPLEALIAGEEVRVYECKADGTVVELPKYDGMPSDGNMLNVHLLDSGELFNQLLEVEDV